MVSIFAILAFVLALPLLSGWRLPPRKVYAQGGETAVMAGSYWSTEGDRDTLIIMNNPSPEPQPVVLTLFSPRGDALYDELLTLQPLESTNLSARSLVGGNRFGHLGVRYASELHLLPAQALVIDGNGSRRIDMVSSALMAENAKKTTALVPVSWEGKPIAGEVVLTNSSSTETIAGEVHLKGKEKEIRFAFRLKPLQMELVELKLSQFEDEQMVTLAVRGESPGRPCCGHRGSGCEARRRGDAVASSRSRNTADGPALPATQRATGVCGLWLRCSSSTMLRHRLLLAPCQRSADPCRTAHQDFYHGLLEIESDREAAAGLLVSGFVVAEGAKALPLVFEQRHPLEVLAGFFSPGSRLMLHTDSKEAVVARLSVRLPEPMEAGGGISPPGSEGDAVAQGDARTLDLDLSSATVLDLHDLLGLEEGAAGAVRLEFEEPVAALGQVVEIEEGNVGPLKDPSVTQPYLSFPVRISEGLNTRIRLFNPGVEEIRLSLLLYFDEERYTWPLQKLQPGEHLELDLKAARRLGLADETGQAFPSGEVGQLKVLQWRPTPERLQATVEWEEETSGKRVVFQSCPLCPPVLVEIFFEPSFISGFVGISSPFSVTGLFDDGSLTDVTYDCVYDVDNSSLAAISGPGWVDFFGAGSTNATATFSCESCNDFGGACILPPLLLIATAGLHGEVIEVTISSEKSIKDGGSANYSVSSNMPVASVAWSFQAPADAGNSPSVMFSPQNQVQTTTDGHWFALPNRECPNVTAPSTYDIVATVTLTGGEIRSVQTTLTVDAVWTPAGQVDPNEARVTGVPAMGVDNQGVWGVTGMGTLGRRVPKKQVFVESSSQFFDKADAHEEEHVKHWATDHPLFGDRHQPADFFSQISGFTDSTQQGLLDQVTAQFQTFTEQQDMLVEQGINQSEVLAFAVSDPIAPKFIYQNCGRYQ